MLNKRFEELKLTGSLPSPSGVGLSILRLTQTDDFAITEISRTLQADPTLTGRVLKLANSSAIGAAHAVTTVRDAAIRIGARSLRNLALGFTLISSNRATKCSAFDHERFWSESLVLAVIAQALAARGSTVNAHEAFTCGLLAPIGRLALATVHPAQYSNVLARWKSGDMDELAALENDTFGLDHRELAHVMLCDWKLPESFCVAVLHYDRAGSYDRGSAYDAPPDDAARALTEVLRTAHACTAAFALTESSSPLAARVALEGLERARAALAIDAAELDHLLADLCIVLEEWGKLLGVRAARAPSLESITTLAQGAPAAAAVGVAVPLAAPVAAAPLETKPRIVVAEQDSIARELASTYLARAGYEVLCASDGKQALALALEHAPHMVVVGWTLAELDGVEVTRTLRRSDEGKKLQIIMLIGREQEARALEAFVAGVDEYLSKPFNPKILVARVRAAQRVIELREQVERDREDREQQLAQLAVLTRKLQTAALTDALTELPNRRFALTHLEHEVARLRAVRVPLSVIMIDIDKFKSVNDDHGHDVGDVVLKETATLLRRCLRTSDKVCRLGGEEFLVICPRADIAAASLVAERLRIACEANVIAHGSFHRAVTLSLGVAQFDPRNPSVDALIKAADLRVYAAKASGRNRVIAGDDPAVQRALAG